MANIFVTGATGFLGWEIVKNLLKDKDSKLFLLVMPSQKESPKQRIVNLINRSYSDVNKRKDVYSKIKVIEGNITKKNLGLSKSQMEKLCRRVNVIYHSAALCKFGIPLKHIRKVNVDGAKNVLDFALRCKRYGQFKAFHHISTVAVGGKTGGVLYEHLPAKPPKFNNTYEQTKFEAEKLVERYRKKGLSIVVYRPSVIVGNSITGEAHNLQIFYQPLHIFSLGLFDKIPGNKRLGYNLVPVDYVGRAIYLISTNYINNKIYHLANTSAISFNFFLDLASEYFGFKKPRIVSNEEFDFKGLRNYKKKLIEPYLPYFNHKEVTFDNANFKEAVKGKGFRWPVVNRPLLARLFKYCSDIGYIKRKVVILPIR